MSRDGEEVLKCGRGEVLKCGSSKVQEGREEMFNAEAERRRGERGEETANCANNANGAAMIDDPSDGGPVVVAGVDGGRCCRLGLIIWRALR